MKNRVVQSAKNIKSIEEFNKWYKKAKKYADSKDLLSYIFGKQINLLFYVFICC